MAIGKRIQQRLKELNWRAARLLERDLGLSRQNLSLMIKKDSAYSRFAVPIAEALGITINDLLYGSDVPLDVVKSADPINEARRARLAAWFRNKTYPRRYHYLSQVIRGKLRCGKVMAASLEKRLNMPHGYLIYPFEGIVAGADSAKTGNMDAVIQETLTDLTALIPFSAKLPENDGEKEIHATFTLDEAAMLVAYRKCSPKLQAVVFNLMSYEAASKVPHSVETAGS
jgi:hypothetical protein